MCSAAVLFLLMVVRARADPKALLRRLNSHRVRAARGRRLLGGSILYAAQSIGFQLAANLTSIANVLIIVALMPLCGAVWEHVLLGMALQRHTWIACGICVVFVAAVITDSYMRQGETSAALEGDLIALTVPLAMGLYFCAMKEPAKNGSSKVQKQALGSQPSHPHALEVPHAHTHALTVVGVPTAGESDKCGIDRHSESDDTPVMVVILGNLLAALMAVIALHGERGETFGALAPDSAGALCAVLAVGLVVIPASFTLLSYAAVLIPGAEVSLIMLFELAVSPLLVWAAGFERPSDVGLGAGCAILLTLATHSLIEMRVFSKGAAPGRESQAEATATSTKGAAGANEREGIAASARAPADVTGAL